MIHVIATVQLAPGTRGPFLEEFRKVVPLVRAEDGCLEYGAAIDEPDKFLSDLVLQSYKPGDERPEK